ncbi:cell division protein FtsL [Marinobacter sp. SS21]|uniref:cell division protein FtsL n=1 Tax=Marinobacter sp. SS21 TaxID=2979460 RepID=UPI00232DBCD6|nr:cell division protein FtsL [Marinobacter sp. SS21]MDC0664086.1 cell division protein FtsL [Marinobacter sp. SS21]
MGAVIIERPVKSQTVKLNAERLRQGVSRAYRLSGRIFGALAQRDVLISLGLVLVLITSAIGVVVSAHTNRGLFNELSELQERRDAYQREWSQLLLEQSALSAHGRIEYQASEKLGMVVPGKQDIVLVPAAPADIQLW